MKVGRPKRTKLILHDTQCSEIPITNIKHNYSIVNKTILVIIINNQKEYFHYVSEEKLERDLTELKKLQ